MPYNDLFSLSEVGEKFGVKFINTKETRKKRNKSFVPPNKDDGALITNHGYFSSVYEQDQRKSLLQNTNALIDTYRNISQHAIVELAIDEITNEAVNLSTEEDAVKINLDGVDLPDKYKKQIIKEFETIYRLYNFKNKGHDIFKRWYIDGKIHFHMVVNEKNLKEGIQEFRFIDPKRIRLIREKRRGNRHNNEFIETEEEYNEYFIYSLYPIEGGVDGVAGGLKIAKDSIVYVTSGNVDYGTNNVISYLHKVIRPHNLLVNMENATVIFKMARAPEKRAFYIDVSGIPANQTSKYINELISRIKNKVEFNPDTGEIEANTRFTSMLQDYFLPQRDGKGTQIETIQGSTGFDNMEPLEYFKDLLKESLYIPKSRFEKDTGFSLGRDGEITRDEVRYSKFIARLRNKFSQIFEQALGFQLRLKGLVKGEEWEKIRHDIKFEFKGDNYFNELTETFILTSRAETASSFTEHVDSGYVSKAWVRRNIWKFTEEEIKQIEKERKEEQKEEMEEGGGEDMMQGNGGFDESDFEEGGPSEQNVEQENGKQQPIEQ